jgi:hypothetical protein
MSEGFLIPHLEAVNHFHDTAFLVGPPLLAMGVEHDLQAIVHGVGSYKDNNIRMVDPNMGHSNFIGPNQ